MFGGLNPKKMQGLMKQMGIAQSEIPAKRVVIEKRDGTKTIIENPSVLKINMQGQEMFQVSGESSEVSEENTITEEDIETVISKTGVSHEVAKKTLEETGDLAETILLLSE